VESYGAWERRAVSLLTRDTSTPADALAQLRDVTDAIASWAPGSGSLQDVVHAAFDRHAAASSSGCGDADGAIKRWLAARLFGTWTAYQRDGLTAIVDHLRSCFDTLTRARGETSDAREAIRQSDLAILHRA
jgi:hypothetical protein